LSFASGFNLGDVITKGRALYGDGVNIAARLEALAEPSGICNLSYSPRSRDTRDRILSDDEIRASRRPHLRSPEQTEHKNQGRWPPKLHPSNCSTNFHSLPPLPRKRNANVTAFASLRTLMLPEGWPWRVQDHENRRPGCNNPPRCQSRTSIDLQLSQVRRPL
jgi:hypothetical protein